MPNRAKLLCAPALLLALALLPACGLLKPDGDGSHEASYNIPDLADDEAGEIKGEHLVDEEGDEFEGPFTHSITMAFTGDVNLADDWENMQVYHNSNRGLEDCFSAPLRERLLAADILLVNNEFTFSTRGEAMEDKLYTFRADPANVDILVELGVDIVSLGNNHVYDYGTDAFRDTLNTLEGARTPYVGAGRNLAEARAPVYFELEGYTIAYIAASRAEKYILTPEATDSEPGVFWCYDGTLLLQTVAEARDNADFVVVYPHWGTENTYQLEDEQVALAHALVDAGADLVVGAHPHVLQGIEYYNGVPIVYSLGNFWFNTETVDTALLEATIDRETGELTVVVQPCLQAGGTTALLQDEDERRALFDLFEGISNGVTIGDDGVVAPAAE